MFSFVLFMMLVYFSAFCGKFGSPIFGTAIFFFGCIGLVLR